MTATLLWRELKEEGAWVGEERARRLARMVVFEGMVACWEPLVERLAGMLKDGARGREGSEIRDEVREIVSGWEEGLPLNERA